MRIQRAIHLGIITLFSTIVTVQALASPIARINRDSPRDTMRTFMQAMNDYKAGIDKDNPQLKSRIDDAIACLDLTSFPVISQQQAGKDSALMLKEIIDRVEIPRYALIPDSTDVQKWNFADSEIQIDKITEGENEGLYLFSSTTVDGLSTMFKKVKKLPYLRGTGQGAYYVEPWLNRNMPDWAHNKIGGVEYWQFIGLFVSILLGFTMRAVTRLIGAIIIKLTHRTSTQWDDIIVRGLVGPVSLFLACGLWFGSIYILNFEGHFAWILNSIVKLALFASIIWIGYRLTDVFCQFLSSHAERTESRLDDQIVKLISRCLKISVVVFGTLLAIQNLGIEVFSLLAGLGIGGLAVALAAKDTLANFFGSIMIMIDRPFRVGHWIKSSGQEGTVEDIGFRSTKLRTFYNSVISVPNSELATSSIDNMGKREYRRVRTILGVTYDTPPDKIEAFLEGIKNIIKANKYTRKDYFHVVFSDFGASSLDILLYFFLIVPDWSQELVQRQNVYLEIIRLANELGVDFAFPTQSLHIETFPEKQNVRKPHDTNWNML
ncbi:MAG: mechanosensitive ion channel family protein, partial [Verrucomicrobiota bacterium]